MIYLAFFKSLITTIKPIFFRFFSIIKYLVLALLAILLYLLVGRVGAWHVWDISSIIELQYNDTWHNRWLEHIDYANEFLSRWDAYYINDTHKQNPLWYNYSYAKWYKVLYLSNSIYWVFVFKKWTFTHTLGYPYGTTWFASFEIPTNWFLWKITNIFSSKKFKNIKATWNWFIFYNLNNDDIEITSHVCGREFPWYYFDHTTRGRPLKIFDFKNKLLYEYDGVPHAKAWPNSGGCWILPYLDEEANRIYNFTYSKTQKHNSSPIFVWWIISNTYVYHTNGNNRLFTDAYNELNSYKRFYIKWEQLATSKKPEQYQAQVETYNNSILKITCEKTAKDINKQISLLHQCKERTKPDNVYWRSLIDEFAVHISGRVENYRNPVNGMPANVFMNTRCKQWHDWIVSIYDTYVKPSNHPNGNNSKYMAIYQDLFSKQYDPIANNSSVSFNEDSYCENNPLFIRDIAPVPPITQIIQDRWDGLYNSYSWWIDGITGDNTPVLLQPFKSLFDNYFSFKKYTIIETINYCKEQGGRTFANLLYFFVLISVSLFLVRLFK